MTTLLELGGTRWRGTSELWLDPLGDQGVTSPCSLEIDGSTLRYRWSHEGKQHDGVLTLSPGARFVDTFHSPQPMECRALPSARGLVQVEGRYGDELEWGWRIGLFQRAPSGELLLQMTNVAPWGEEVRAVRMTLERV